MQTQAGHVAAGRRVVTPAAVGNAAAEERPAVASAPMVAPALDALRPGAAVGEYVLTDKLGEGGMGVVWAGVHPVIGKKVAIKLLNPGLSQDPTIVQRFLQEARAVNQIGHRNIVDIFAFGQLPSGRHYFVMEHLKGVSLKQRLEREPPLSRHDGYVVLAEVADALAAAHAQGIVHRDLKPDNIFLCEDLGDGAAPRVKLLDFGIAKLLRRSDEGMGQTRTGAPIGTPYYMSPEQCRSKGVDARTDLYAMGVIIFEMFTGRLPFAGADYIDTVNAHLSAPPPLPTDFADLPVDLEALILGCLEKDPDRRPQRAEELSATLRQLEASAGDERLPTLVRNPALFSTSPAYTPGGTAHPNPTLPSAPFRRVTPPPAGLPTRPAGRSSLTAVAGAVAVAALALVAAAAWRSSQRPRGAPVATEVALDVSSDPPGAIVLIDGRAQSQPAPGRFGVPRAHEVVVRMEKPGYRPHDELVHLDDGANSKTVVAHLEPLPGLLRAKASARDTAWTLDGAAVGVGAALSLHQLAAGPHRLRAEAKGFEPREELVRLDPGATTAVEWELQPSARRRRGATRPSAVPDAPNLDFKAPR